LKKLTPEENAVALLWDAMNINKEGKEELLNFDVLARNGRIIKVDARTLPKYREDFVFSHASERDEASQSRGRRAKKQQVVEPLPLYNYKNPAPFINQNEDR
jgi:hypothetical protein